MKIFGKKYTEPHSVKLYLPRGDDVIEVTAYSILDDAEFYKICPEPKPPMRMIKGGKKESDHTNKQYLQEVEDFGKRRLAWMILTSIKITGAEWETVDLKDPNTWLSWRKELKDSGFNDVEITRMNNLMYEANCLSDEKLDEARNRFLAKQLERELQSFQKEEQLSLVSGEHVNGLASDHQESIQQDLKT